MKFEERCTYRTERLKITARSNIPCFTLASMLARSSRSCCSRSSSAALSLPSLSWDSICSERFVLEPLFEALSLSRSFWVI